MGTVSAALQSRLDQLGSLRRIANGEISEFSNDQLLRLDLGYGQPGPIEDDQLADEAGERLDELPLSVSAKMAFEISLTPSRSDQSLADLDPTVPVPTESLLVECAALANEAGEPRYGRDFEIERVTYLYRAEREAVDIELEGEEKEIAVDFARHVVLELVE